MLASFPLDEPESALLRLDEDEPSFLTVSLLLLSELTDPPRLESLSPLSLISPLYVLDVALSAVDLLDDLFSTF